MLGMTFVFIIAQGIVLSRYVNASNVETGESGETDKVE
jgi:hypothetical protein